MKIDTRENREEFDRQRGTPPADSKRYRVRHPLDILAGVIAETTKVYRKMRNEKLDHDKGRSLVWVLSQLRAMVVPIHRGTPWLRADKSVV